ncbi:uncharacterized protein LOC126334038, partial [Schistocerca gregaria]|uniref:uncharacterized protein LOC126334038 n=1 Tax=Schistocerca gregaria TaxID=7010 RepID=UPI00211ECEE5
MYLSCAREQLVMHRLLSSFAIADEIQFFNDLKKTFKENIPHINFFQEGEHYCDSEFIRCNDEKKITTIEIINIRNKDKRLPYSPTNINNDITLPSSISTLTHLTELNISIAVVRINWDNIVNLRSLRTIKIISNNIYEFLRLDGLSLTHLHLSYNNIEQDLHSISFSKTLKYINLSNNNFCGDIKIFNNIPDLEKLDLSYNPLLYVNTSQLHLSFKLSVLSLVGNKLIGNIPNFRNNGELTL